MKINIRRLIGLLGIVYVGFSLFITPSMSPVGILEGFNALERIKKKSELKEDVEKVEVHMQILSNERNSAQTGERMNLGLVLMLSILLASLKDKSEPAGSGNAG